MQSDQAHLTKRIRLFQRPKSLPCNRIKSFAKVFSEDFFTGVVVTQSAT